MGPPSYMRSVVNRNVVMQRVPVVCIVVTTFYINNLIRMHGVNNYMKLAAQNIRTTTEAGYQHDGKNYITRSFRCL